MLLEAVIAINNLKDYSENSEASTSSTIVM